MNEIVERIYFLWCSIVGFIGLAVVAFLFLNNYLPLIGVHVDSQFIALATMLSLLLIAVGIERWKQHENVEDKLTQLFEAFESYSSVSQENFETLRQDVLQVASYEVLEGRDSITKATIAALQNVEDNVRATNFKSKETDEDTPGEFYRALAQQIRLKGDKVAYECCFNAGNSFMERKRAFRDFGLTVRELKSMTYYQFQRQSYFNILIIDDEVMFVGFPRHQHDEHMQIALKIKAGSNHSVRRYIRGLVKWYDNILKKGGNIVDTADLFKDLDQI